MMCSENNIGVYKRTRHDTTGLPPLFCLQDGTNSKFRQIYRASLHDDVIKWKHFPRYWPFVRGIHRSPVNSPHKGQWRRALMFSLICAWINDWVNNSEGGDLRRYRAHYDVTVMNKHYLNKHLIFGMHMQSFQQKRMGCNYSPIPWYQRRFS